LERHTSPKLSATLVLLLAAGATTGGYMLHAAKPSGPCVAAGSVAYRMAASSWSPDVRVRIDHGASPDLRVRLVDDAASADVVLVDEPDATDNDGCNAPELKTVQLVTGDEAGAMTVGIVHNEPADLRLYLRSRASTRPMRPPCSPQ
jgi:hypothetical protein